MNLDRFVNAAPRTICATLLDEGRYLCSPRTLYRILKQHGQTTHRRQKPPSPPRPVPRLSATAPNQVWSWDITKLRADEKGRLFYLYVIIDIFSRSVVGWRLESCERAELAAELIETTCRRQGIGCEQLTLHADRGASMRSDSVSALLSRLEVSQSHSRPYTPDDNPFSESQFKTLKYHPTFPGSFLDLESARAFCRQFFGWYNHEHRHSGIAMYTPHTVHLGQVKGVQRRRQKVLDMAHCRHPERFVQGPPKAKFPPKTVWINQPEQPESSAGPVGAVENSHEFSKDCEPVHSSGS